MPNLVKSSFKILKKLKLKIICPVNFFQGEFLQGMIKYSDNLNNNVSDRTWINYRSEFGIDESFVSSVPGNLNFFM